VGPTPKKARQSNKKRTGGAHMFFVHVYSLHHDFAGTAMIVIDQIRDENRTRTGSRPRVILSSNEKVMLQRTYLQETSSDKDFWIAIEISNEIPFERVLHRFEGRHWQFLTG
jgi:hypothetical protein